MGNMKTIFSLILIVALMGAVGVTFRALDKIQPNLPSQSESDSGENNDETIKGGGNSDESSSDTEQPETNSLLDLVKYNGFQISSDDTTVSWEYEVDRNKLNELEKEHSVVFGLCALLKEKNGVILYTDSPIPYDMGDEIICRQSDAIVKTLYSTDYRYGATQQFDTVTPEKVTFSYKISGVDKLTDREVIECCAFAFLDGKYRMTYGMEEQRIGKPVLSKDEAAALARGALELKSFTEPNGDMCWTYKVDWNKVKDIMDSGFSVSVGIINTTQERDGNIYSSTDPTVYYGENGFAPSSSVSLSGVHIYMDSSGKHGDTSKTGGDLNYFLNLHDIKIDTITLKTRAFICIDYDDFFYTGVLENKGQTKLSLEGANGYAGEAIKLADVSCTRSGFRWVYSVSHDKINGLEYSGYNVSFGAVLKVDSYYFKKAGTETIEETVSPNDDLAQVKFNSKTGYSKTLNTGSVVLVYDTQGNYSPTNDYVQRGETNDLFGYRATTVGSMDGTYYITLSCRGFVAVDGDKTIRYTEPKTLSASITIRDGVVTEWKEV